MRPSKTAAGPLVAARGARAGGGQSAGPEGAPPAEQQGDEQPPQGRLRTARAKVIEHWLEILATAILALGSIVAAWSGNQSALWGSVQSSSYTQAGARRVEATRAAARAGQIIQIDIANFNNYAEARNAGDDRLAQFYERRFRPEFRVAFEAWLALSPLINPDAPPSPVLMPEYSIAEEQRAVALTREAEELFARGERANTISSAYAVNGFITALALFFAGIAPRFVWRPVKIAVVVIAFAVLLWAAGNALVYPAQPVFFPVS